METTRNANAEELYSKSVIIYAPGSSRGSFGDPLGPDLAPPGPLGSPPEPQLGFRTDSGNFAELKSSHSVAYMQRIEGALCTEGKNFSPGPLPA